MGNALAKYVFPVDGRGRIVNGLGDEVLWVNRPSKLRPHAKKIAVVCFHGNMEDAAAALRHWNFLDDDTFDLKCYEYPGYGHRYANAASETAINAELPEMIRQLMSYEAVVVCGRSLGSWAALRLSVKLGEKCAGLVLVSPMLTALATVMPYPIHRLFWYMDMLVNETEAPKLGKHVPKVIYHGLNDTVVPLSNGEALAKLFTPAARITTFDAGHNNTMGMRKFAEEATKTIHGWLEIDESSTIKGWRI